MLIKWIPTAEVNMVKNSRGCYQIRTAADLYRLNSWFLLQQASNRQVRSEK